MVMLTFAVWWVSGSPELPPRLDQFGVAHRLDRPEANWTVVDFSASWCKPCWRALPQVAALKRSHPDLRVVVVSEDKRVKGRDLLVSKLGLTLPVIWDQDHVLAKHFKPAGMPATMILNRQGEVVYRHTGYSPQIWSEFLLRLNQITRDDGG